MHDSVRGATESGLGKGWRAGSEAEELKSS